MTDEANKTNDMMFCEECGTKIKRGVKFCENCGIQINYVEGRPVFGTQQNMEQQPTPVQPQPTQQTTPPPIIYNNPFGNTYADKPVNTNLIKMIIIAVLTAILVMLWLCAPVIRLDYENTISSTSDYFSSSDYGRNLTMGNLFNMAENIMNSDYTLPDSLASVMSIMIFMSIMLFVFVIFAGIFIYNLIKMDAEAIKDDGPKVTTCTFIVLFFIYCLVIALNNFVENDYISIMHFGFGAGSYIIIALTIAMQCVASSLTLKNQENTSYMAEQTIRRETWTCPTCGTSNPGNTFCQKCGFENRILR